MDKSELIQRISAVMWDDFGTAECSENNLRRALLAIVENGSVKALLSAKDELETAIVRDRDLFESAFYVIPFLVDILNLEEDGSTICALELLLAIQDAWASWDRSISVRLPYGDQASNRMIPLQVACRFALGCGIPSYIRILKERSKFCKIKTVELLAHFVEYDVVLYPLLKECWRAEQDMDVKTAIKIAIDSR